MTNSTSDTWNRRAARLRATLRLHTVVLTVLTAVMVFALIATMNVGRDAADTQAAKFDAYYQVDSTIADILAIRDEVTTDGRVSTESLIRLKGERDRLATHLTNLSGPGVTAADAIGEGEPQTAIAAGAALLASVDEIVLTAEKGQDLIFPVNVAEKFDALSGAASRWADIAHGRQVDDIAAARGRQRRMMTLIAVLTVVLGLLAIAAGRLSSRTTDQVLDDLQRTTSEQAALGELAQSAAGGGGVDRLVELMQVHGREPLGAARLDVVVGDSGLGAAETAATLSSPFTRGVSCPVAQGDDRVGCLTAWWDAAPPSDAAATMARLASGMALAIDGVSAREALRRQADTDGLTGLPNHRVFHERLAAMFTSPTESPVPSVASIDLDGLREINATYGHAIGDRLLVELTARMTSILGPDDTLARISGAQLAWIITDCSDECLSERIESARIAVSTEPVEPVGGFTISVGFADGGAVDDPNELVRRADLALTAAKHAGRDTAVEYTELLEDDGSDERRTRLSQRREYTALQSLARAVDLRDRTTQRHSERVAAISHLLATAIGWDPERASRLRQAALVHDVGKVGVPDSVLLKPGKLTTDERAIIESHAALSAAIVSEVLDDEQVAWVRGHHERIDGAGYPDGLIGPEIPDGARLMAVADTWDAMTGDRPYRRGMDTATAIRICHEVAGTQLCMSGVDALQLLLETGELGAAVESVNVQAEAEPPAPA
ncbi:MAG: diguanylate cyclase [Thermoleophilia bacterium]